MDAATKISFYLSLNKMSFIVFTFSRIELPVQKQHRQKTATEILTVSHSIWDAVLKMSDFKDVIK